MTALSMTDPLTGLNNRRGFVDSLEALVAQDATKATGALFYIDLDNFKQVNDTHGHQTGDEALLEVAARSEEHTSELQSLMRISYAVFCLKKKQANKTDKKPDLKK